MDENAKISVDLPMKQFVKAQAINPPARLIAS
jgi:hypothetical protein